ncbi:MAG: hypothetical protein WC479_03180 [Candidatus Izemoplasmatales bacterium]
MIKKQPDNPHALSQKQRMVVADVVAGIKAGEGLDVTRSVLKFHKTKNPSQIASRHMSNVNFREALIEDLYRGKVIGKNSKVNKVLMEGLEAVSYTKDGDIAGEDFKARLAYVQEINKITGVYAPERSDKRTLNVNMNIPPEELEQRIQELRNQVM